MKQLFNHRIFVLVAGFISIVIIIILSTGIESLVFMKSIALEPTAIDTNQELRFSAIPERDWYIIVTIAVLSIFIILALVFGKPKQIPSILPILLPLVIISLVLAWWISREKPNIDVTQPITSLPTSISSQETRLPNQEQVPESAYIPQRISPWISFGLTFIILLSIIIFIWFILHKHRRGQVTLNNIAGIAEQAINNLKSGKDYEDVVIDCYANMIVEVNNQHSIQRRVDLTPTEFIGVLNHAGVPFDPVHHLTDLFEKVRYGGKETSEIEIKEATKCLTEIISAIREIDEKKE